MNFIEELIESVEEYKTRKNIEIIQFKIFPPNEKEVEEVESVLKFPLDDGITEFYKSCGGIKLIWVDTTRDADGEMSETANYYIKNKNNLYESEDDCFVLNSGDYYMPPTGAIIIPNIKFVFQHNLGNLIDDVNNLIISHKEKGSLKRVSLDNSEFKIQPFDLFNEYEHVSFLTTGNSNPFLIYSTVAFASFSNSKLVTFYEYSKILVNFIGNLDLRRELMNEPIN